MASNYLTLQNLFQFQVPEQIDPKIPAQKNRHPKNEEKKFTGGPRPGAANIPQPEHDEQAATPQPQESPLGPHGDCQQRPI